VWLTDVRASREAVLDLDLLTSCIDLDEAPLNATGLNNFIDNVILAERRYLETNALFFNLGGFDLAEFC
jgi:hypothetical protein